MRKEWFLLWVVSGLAAVPGWAQSPQPSVGTVEMGSAIPQGPGEPATGPMEGRWYGRVEYVLWWLREGRLPPTLTTGSAVSQGVLGQDSTRVLYGGDRLETRHGDRFNGIRFALGWWLDPDHSLAVEGGGFFLERDSTYFKAVSSGDTLLARPYINGLTGAPASEVIAGPGPQGTLAGGFNGYSRVELFGEEINLVAPLLEDGAFRLDVLAGARFLQMRDRTDLTSAGRLLPDRATLFGLTDHLRTDDHFYGGQAGLRAEVRRGRWSLDMRSTVALGGTEQIVRAFGDRTFQTPLVKVVLPYGLAVQPGNTGTFHDADCDVVYEVGINAAYQLTRYVRVLAGYTFLGWASPIRSGDQIDLVVNPRQAPGRPAIPFREDFFWAQGVNAGIDVRW
jgi:hypothetical protein